MAAVAVLLLTACFGEPPAQSPTEGGGISAPEAEISAREIEARRERIRSYFEERRKRLDIVATTKTASGQIIDWIRPESQTSDGTLAPVPDTPPPSGAEPGARGSEPPPIKPGPVARTEVQIDPEARGPEGTVPVVRFDVEAYLQSVKVPPADPRDVLKKTPPPVPPPSPPPES